MILYIIALTTLMVIYFYNEVKVAKREKAENKKALYQSAELIVKWRFKSEGYII